MRHSATRSLLERNDVIIVASVSCIYGLGSPEAYHGMLLYLEKGMAISREKILSKLVEIQYERNDIDFHRGTFRVRGDVIEVFPAHEENRAIRIELFGDEVDAISEIDPLRGKVLQPLEKVPIYPGSHYVTFPDRIEKAIQSIREELKERLRMVQIAEPAPGSPAAGAADQLRPGDARGARLLPGHRELFPPPDGEEARRAPSTLLDYFPKDYLLFIDESHVTLPQLIGMYRGRPVPEGDPGGIRIPPSFGPGQSAPHVRGVPGAGQPGRSMSRPPRATMR